MKNVVKYMVCLKIKYVKYIGNVGLINNVLNFKQLPSKIDGLCDRVFLSCSLQAFKLQITDN